VLAFRWLSGPTLTRPDKTSANTLTQKLANALNAEADSAKVLFANNNLSFARVAA